MLHALNALSPFSNYQVRKRSSLTSISSVAGMSPNPANANNDPHPIAVAMQNGSLGKRASFDEVYDIHDSQNSNVAFGTSPVKQSPLL